MSTQYIHTAIISPPTSSNLIDYECMLVLVLLHNQLLSRFVKHLVLINSMIPTHQNLIVSSFLVILSLHSLFECCDAKCTPSSCGIIANISSPFRLKGDPKTCGDPRFELSCENNVTSISLHSHKYYVQTINSTNNDEYTMRLVDASINSNDICSFPTYSSSAFDFNFDNPNRLPYLFPINPLPINLISCPNPLTNSSHFTGITTRCVSNSSHHHSHRYAYIKVGHMNASEMPYTCRLNLTTYF